MTERAGVVRNHLEEEAALLSAAPKFEFKVFPEIEEFVANFHPKMRLQRRPILLILGGTNLGKPMLAVNMLTRIGTMLGLKKFVEVTVEDDGNLDLSEFDVTTDAGVLLGGIDDALMLHRH